jgi:hypothetical protein
VALAFLPIAFVTGFVLRDRRQATRVSVGIWAAVLLVLLIAWLAGVGVSPWEALVLVICLAPGVLLARLAAGLRRR